MKSIPAEANVSSFINPDNHQVYPNYYFLKRWLRNILEILPSALWLQGPFANIRQRLASLGWDEKNGYFGQGGQDRVVAELVYPNLKGGVFLEVGANDGIKFSNCYYLEKNLGWSGICVEPNPPIVEKLKTNRRAKIHACCVGSSDAIVDFPVEEDSEKSLFIGVGEASPKSISIPQVPLTRIIRELNFPNPHFLSLDIEGGEYAALKSLFLDAEANFELLPGCISVEENVNPGELDELMFSVGYQLIGRFWPDRIYWMPKIVTSKLNI
jgi:FkbM family methyltransferase